MAAKAILVNREKKFVFFYSILVSVAVMKIPRQTATKEKLILVQKSRWSPS